MRRESFSDEKRHRYLASVMHTGAALTAVVLSFGIGSSTPEKHHMDQSAVQRPITAPLPVQTHHEIACSDSGIEETISLPPNSTNTLDVSNGTQRTELIVYIHEHDAVDAVSEDQTPLVHEEMNLSEFSYRNREINLNNPSSRVVFTGGKNAALPLDVTITC